MKATIAGHRLMCEGLGMLVVRRQVLRVMHREAQVSSWQRRHLPLAGELIRHQDVSCQRRPGTYRKRYPTGYGLANPRLPLEGLGSQQPMR